MDKFLKLPASDVSTWLGLAVSVWAIMAIGKRLPVVKQYI